jgi:hypothetical protein
MSRKVKASSHAPLFPSHAFVELGDLEECLRMIEAGCEYLDSLITGDNINDDDNPFPQAVCSYRNNALARFARIREFLESGAIVLNPKHPAIAEMYDAARRIAEEAPRRHTESLDSGRSSTKAVPKPGPAKSALLLVPSRPGEAPAN